MESTKTTIVCPSCQTFFHTPENSIGPHGRTVRCTVCAQVWFEKPHQKKAMNAAQKLMTSGKPLRHIARSSHAPEHSQKQVYQHFPEDFIFKPKRTIRYMRWILITLLIATLSLCGVLFYQHHEKIIPYSHFYRLLNTSWKTEHQNNQQLVFMQGQLANISDNSTPPPKVKVHIFYEENNTINEQKLDIVPFKEATGPGSITPFEASTPFTTSAKIQNVAFSLD